MSWSLLCSPAQGQATCEFRIGHKILRSTDRDLARLARLAQERDTLHALRILPALLAFAARRLAQGAAATGVGLRAGGANVAEAILRSHNPPPTHHG